MCKYRIKAVLFDWDLTLARTLGDISTQDRLTVLFSSQGLPYSHQEILAAIDRYKEEAGNHRPPQTKPQTRQGIMHYYRQILVYLGHGRISDDLVKRLYDAYGEMPTFLYRDSLETLQRLRQRNLTLGIVSNHSITARPMMEHLVGHLIPSRHIIISEEIGIHKPESGIFHHAASEIDTPPTQCLYVGDNLFVDAFGAVRQGDFGCSLWLDRQNVGTRLRLPEEVAIIHSLAQILNYV